MATIKAKSKWNDTGYQLSAGKQYRFKATGEWIDGGIVTTAVGFEKFYLKPFEWMRRFPNAKWFSVIGAIDKKESTKFDIGRFIEQGETYTATINGTLFCFANDVSIAYGNNKGEIELEIIPV
jgi:hypothetical protein